MLKRKNIDSNTLSTSDDYVSALPPEIRSYIVLNFLSFREIGPLAKTSSLWGNTCGNAELYKNFYPREYAKKTNPEYRKIAGPVDWNFELYGAWCQYCSSFNTKQLNDYFQIRNCRIDGIRQILARKEGFKQIQLVDKQGKHIFDFLAEYEGEDKQDIYDLLFSSIYSEDIEILINMPLWDELQDMIEFEELQARVLSVVCNQIDAIEDFSDEEHEAGLPILLLVLALKYNHETLFFHMESIFIIRWREFMKIF